MTHIESDAPIKQTCGAVRDPQDPTWSCQLDAAHNQAASQSDRFHICGNVFWPPEGRTPAAATQAPDRTEDIARALNDARRAYALAMVEWSEDTDPATERTAPREDQYIIAAIQTLFNDQRYEYRLADLDGDELGTVRGPEAHATQVWNSRRNPESESNYGPEIMLQRRAVTEYQPYRYPATTDLA